MWGESKSNSKNNSANKTDEKLPDAKPVATNPTNPTDRQAYTHSKSTLGPEISIEGTVSCDEDLTVLGTVKGQIIINKNRLAIGQSGYLEANIEAKEVSIEGEVTGNIIAHYIHIHKTGRVNGDITCPRVNLEDGGKFKGNIDMDEEAANNQLGSSNNAKPKVKKQAKPLPVMNSNQPAEEVKH